MNLIFHPEASEEMLESARFYELRSEGLGSDFLSAVEETTRRILELPTLGSQDKRNIRRRLVGGFPFTILYEWHQDHVLRRCHNASATKARVLAKAGVLSAVVRLKLQGTVTQGAS